MFVLGLFAGSAFSQEQRVFQRTVNDGDEEWLFAETLPGSLTVLPDNIVEYLEGKGVSQYYDSGFGFSKSNLLELQKYKNGKRKFYPVKEVWDALHCMQRDIESSYHYNGYMSLMKGDEASHNTFYELIDIAVLLCKDLNHLSKVCSSDHRLGTLDFSPNYEGIFFYSLIYDAGNGAFKAHTVDIVENTAPLDYIRKIYSSQGKSTYIVSMENFASDEKFLLYVVDLYADGTISSCKPANSNDAINEWLGVDVCNNYDAVEIIYNPNKVCWELCAPSGNVYKKIEGTKSLYLEFGKEKPVYVLK